MLALQLRQHQIDRMHLAEPPQGSRVVRERLGEALIGRTPGGRGVYLTQISSFTQASFLVTRARAISPTSTQHAPSSTHASSQRERDRAEGRRRRVRRRRREQVHQLQELFDGLIGRHATHENATAVVAAALLVRTPDARRQSGVSDETPTSRAVRSYKSPLVTAAYLQPGSSHGKSRERMCLRWMCESSVPFWVAPWLRACVR